MLGHLLSAVGYEQTGSHIFSDFNNKLHYCSKQMHTDLSSSWHLNNVNKVEGYEATSVVLPRIRYPKKPGAWKG